MKRQLFQLITSAHMETCSYIMHIEFWRIVRIIRPLQEYQPLGHALLAVPLLELLASLGVRGHQQPVVALAPEGAPGRVGPQQESQGRAEVSACLQQSLGHAHKVLRQKRAEGYAERDV